MSSFVEAVTSPVPRRRRLLAAVGHIGARSGRAPAHRTVQASADLRNTYEAGGLAAAPNAAAGPWVRHRAGCRGSPQASAAEVWNNRGQRYSPTAGAVPERDPRVRLPYFVTAQSTAGGRLDTYRKQTVTTAEPSSRTTAWGGKRGCCASSALSNRGRRRLLSAARCRRGSARSRREAPGGRGTGRVRRNVHERTALGARCTNAVSCCSLPGRPCSRHISQAGRGASRIGSTLVGCPP